MDLVAVGRAEQCGYEVFSRLFRGPAAATRERRLLRRGSAHGFQGLRQDRPGPFSSRFRRQTLRIQALRNAREQHSQQDINTSLIKALGEMAREIKRLDDDVRRARRDAQMSRRF